MLIDKLTRILTVFVLLLACTATKIYAWPMPLVPQHPLLSNIQSSIAKFLAGSSNTSKQSDVKQLRLKNIFYQGATPTYRDLSARYDVDEVDISADEQISGILRTTRVKTWKPKNIHPFLQAHRKADFESVQATSAELDWDEIEVEGPDVEDRETLLTLSKMASKAYDPPKNDSGDAWTVGGKWNLSESFGWVEDGIRGHIFANEDNSTVVVALKGTSAALLDDGTTSKRDKENDNLLFSCCCAHVGWTWHTVCDCFNDGLAQQTCSSKCLTKALINKSFFYPATTDLFNNISYAYPDSNIWITGHSLGGSLGALIGMTFGLPTVTFEAPAERMAALRLHLPIPNRKGGKKKKTSLDELPITHVYHTGDPIPMGECVGATSLCANFGFAMESKCHSGKTILYDTVGKLGWTSSVLTHKIATLTDDLLTEDWAKKVAKAKAKAKKASPELAALRHWWQRKPKKDDDSPSEDVEKLGAVPKLIDEDKCVDCQDWQFTKE